MNILTYIQIQAGGPGSGRHPDFGVNKSFYSKKEALEHAKERRSHGEDVKILVKKGFYLPQVSIGTGKGADKVVKTDNHYQVMPKSGQWK